MLALSADVCAFSADHDVAAAAADPVQTPALITAAAAKPAAAPAHHTAAPALPDAVA